MIKNTHKLFENKVIPGADGFYNVDFNININTFNKVKILVKVDGEMPTGFKASLVILSELLGEIERQEQQHNTIVNNSYFMKDILIDNYYLFDSAVIKFKIPYASPTIPNNSYKLTIIVYTIDEEDTEGYEPFYVKIGP